MNGLRSIQIEAPCSHAVDGREGPGVRPGGSEEKRGVHAVASGESGAESGAAHSPAIVYISGPISGRPNLNRPAFDGAAKALRAAGYQAVNPFEVCPNPESWQHAMRADIKALMDCTHIATLPDWERSTGAVIEVWIADKLGLQRAPVEAYAEWEES